MCNIRTWMPYDMNTNAVYPVLHVRWIPSGNKRRTKITLGITTVNLDDKKWRYSTKQRGEEEGWMHLVGCTMHLLPSTLRYHQNNVFPSIFPRTSVEQQQHKKHTSFTSYLEMIPYNPKAYISCYLHNI